VSKRTLLARSIPWLLLAGAAVFSAAPGTPLADNECGGFTSLPLCLNNTLVNGTPPTYYPQVVGGGSGKPMQMLSISIN